MFQQLESHLQEAWVVFQTITLQEFVKEMVRFSRNIQLERYKKHRRGPKKKQPQGLR